MLLDLIIRSHSLVRHPLVYSVRWTSLHWDDGRLPITSTGKDSGVTARPQAEPESNSGMFEHITIYQDETFVIFCLFPTDVHFPENAAKVPNIVCGCEYMSLLP